MWGNVVKKVALEDLVANPRENIRLKRGDIITMITNPNSFTSLGCSWSCSTDQFFSEGVVFS